MNTEKPIFDYSKLRGKIKEKFANEGQFAEKLGVSSVWLSNVFNSKAYFDQPQIDKACMLLEILSIEIPIYFFTIKVKEN